MHKKATIKATTALVGLFIFGAGFLSPAAAATVQPGEGLSHVYLRECGRSSDARIWQSMASQNGSSNWEAFNNGLRPFQNINVSCSHSTPTQPAAQIVAVQRQSAPASYAVGCENYRGLVQRYFGAQTNTAMAVMRAESGCNPQAVNWEAHYDFQGRLICRGSFGLFQISCHDGALYNPEANVAAAARKFNASGWRPWGVCTSGKVSC